jgi:hypothetical protein
MFDDLPFFSSIKIAAAEDETAPAAAAGTSSGSKATGGFRLRRFLTGLFRKA